MDWRISGRSGGPRTLAHARPLRASSVEQTGHAYDNPKSIGASSVHRGVSRNGVGSVLCSPGGLPPSAKEDDVRCPQTHVVGTHRHVPDLRPRALARDAAPSEGGRRGLFLLLSSAAVQPDPSV
ncbi:hypothetical protein MRX96_001379 [Rhipicephalus microplus]